MMWTKDVYQEQMLGYLGEVEAEIEQLAYSRPQQRDLKEFYIDLDITVKRLWRLIAASDVNWEELRYPLEISCDRLQGAFYPLLRTDDLIVPASFPMTETRERWAELREMAEMLGY